MYCSECPFNDTIYLIDIHDFAVQQGYHRPSGREGLLAMGPSLQPAWSVGRFASVPETALPVTKAIPGTTTRQTLHQFTSIHQVALVDNTVGNRIRLVLHPNNVAKIRASVCDTYGFLVVRTQAHGGTCWKVPIPEKNPYLPIRDAVRCLASDGFGCRETHCTSRLDKACSSWPPCYFEVSHVFFIFLHPPKTSQWLVPLCHRTCDSVVVSLTLSNTVPFHSSCLDISTFDFPFVHF